MENKTILEEKVLRNQPVNNNFWKDLFYYKSQGYNIKIVPVYPGVVDLEMSKNISIQ